MKVIAEGLQFPEGPVWLSDGSIVLVEIARGTVTRIDAQGGKTVVAHTGAGPNGAALGPDGAVYICNNGGFSWTQRNGALHPGGQPDDYVGGSIQRVELTSGRVETLYEHCNGVRLKGPNDLVFDRDGGFYFTDIGKRRARDRDYGGIYYASPDGSRIVEVSHPLETPNGIGLSPDERTLYFAEMHACRLWAYDIGAPGELIKRADTPNGARLVCGLPGYRRFDSLAVEASGNICVATMETGCITVIDPGGRAIREIQTGDPQTTNLCFGGKDLATAYITLSGKGQLAAVAWAAPGLALNFQR